MTSRESKDIFFSVIISCFNSELYIEEAIHSVISQSFRNWELIIVDDCSSDSTYSILQKFSYSDERIRIYRLDSNQGPAFARNFAASHARGIWLAILDSDDIFMPHKLLFQSLLIINSPNKLVLVASSCIFFTSKASSGKVIYPRSSSELKKSLFSMSKFPPHSSIVLRASTFLEVGGYNILFSRAEDYDLYLRMADFGLFVSAYQPLVKYRVRPTSLSNSLSDSGYSISKYGLVANICWRLSSFDSSLSSVSVASLDSLLSFVSTKYLGRFFSFFEMFKLSLKASSGLERFLVLFIELTKKPHFVILFFLFLSPSIRLIFLAIISASYQKHISK